VKIIFGVIAIILIVVAGAFYYFYPTLYGIIPDNSNIPRFSDLENSSSIENLQTKTDTPAETIIAEGLDTPWAIAFLPSGEMLVTERKGTVRLIDKSVKLQDAPVATIEKVKEAGEGGLLGIALHPDFENNNFVYLYYTYSGEEDSLNRVVRMKYSNGVLGDEQIIVDAIPGNSNHNGGRIKFGPDKFLYITTGDAENPSQAQDTNTLGGKILRVTNEGKPAPGNSFNNLVYSYGHRNPQGIAWDSNNQLWETEHGPSGGSLGTGNDEVNFIEPGKNYGWPEIQGEQTKDGMITPVKNSTPSVAWAPGDLAIVGDTLYFGGLRSQALYRSKIDNGRLRTVEELLKGRYGRIREVILGPDNMLYISTSNKDGRGVPGKIDDRIIRINPQKI
jgi:glucose/arabinose dehydrogenase